MIHPTAILSKNAEVDKEVSIGPYCVIEGNVKIQKGTELVSHVNISGNTYIGQNNKFFPFSSIGQVPQDKKFKGEASKLIIGVNNIIRENLEIITSMLPLKEALSSGAIGHKRFSTSPCSRSINLDTGTSRATSLPLGLTPTVPLATSSLPATSTYGIF